ncbi:MAG: triose-phosphate isomerase [Pseudomonadota bacterium]
MDKKLAAGNWKMNGLDADLAGFAALPNGHTEVLICPPTTLIGVLRSTLPEYIKIGAQDCHSEVSGAYTGDVSAHMLRTAGASHVILGHSERRDAHGESDYQVKEKTKAAHDAGLVAIVCVGETLAERDAGETLDVIRMSLAGSLPDGASSDNTIIAYEPVWAIGTGRTPTFEEIAEVHTCIADLLQARFGERFRILYGGSMKPENAADISSLPFVDGGLIGGASLSPESFGAIAKAIS